MTTKKYQKPEMEIILLEAAQIIAASTPGINNSGHTTGGVARAPRQFWEEDAE